jgi:uncharacterized delta-60 repeat protein
MQSNRERRAGAILVLALALVAAAMALPALSTAARLDPQFGAKGKALIPFPGEEVEPETVHYALPFEFAPGSLVMAAAPAGKVVVASSQSIAEYLPNGRPDRGFGGDGRIAVAPQAGSQFQLAGVAVDSQGRVLLAGTTKPRPARAMVVPPISGPIASSATVMRYQADGTPDAGFGNGGVLSTDLGFAPPSYAGWRFEKPAVVLTGVAVDSQDRPILTGGAVSTVRRCDYLRTTEFPSTAFLARLTDAGALDTTLNGTGVQEIGGLSSLNSPVTSPLGGFFTVGSQPTECARGASAPRSVANFGPGGGLLPGFGSNGLRTVVFASIPAIAATPSGGLVLLGRTESRAGVSTKLVRLLPDGSFDAGFGGNGRKTLSLPHGVSFSALAVDGHGRVLLAGKVSKRTGGGPARTQARFALTRLTSGGKVDRRFASRGSVTTGFGRRASGGATQILLSGRGGILLGGMVSNPRLSTGGGFGLARYLSGP